jgi:hypothetical protein
VRRFDTLFNFYRSVEIASKHQPKLSTISNTAANFINLTRFLIY